MTSSDIAEHCRWLIASGCDGVGANGSLGEYASLTDEERRAVAETAVWAVGDSGVVVVGVHAPGSHQARMWTEHARDIGADAVLCLPPTTYRASRAEILDHFAIVAAVGLPVMVYNNPIDTKVDLTPDLLTEICADRAHRGRQRVLRRRAAHSRNPGTGRRR